MQGGVLNIKKQFIKFLKDEGIYFMYRQNWDNDNPKTKSIKDPKNYVGLAFNWYLADFSCGYLDNGNYKFWQNIHKKWLSHLESIGYKK